MWFDIWKGRKKGGPTHIYFASNAHADNIFLQHCSLFIIKINFQNTVKEPYK